jgi:hypothetical protein
MYSQYLGFLRVVEEYPRFLHSSISFSEFRDNYTSILVWLHCKEAKELPATSYHSTAYWTSMPQVATLVGLQESEPEINSKDKNINLPLLVVTSKVESHQIDSGFEDFSSRSTTPTISTENDL